MSALIANYQKYVTALVGAIGLAVSQGLIDGSAAKWTAIGIAFLTSLGVYRVPNRDPDAPLDAGGFG